MENKFKEFIKCCLDNDDVEGICSLRDYKEIQEQLIKDGFLGDSE